MNTNVDLAEAARLVLRQWLVLLVSLMAVAGLLGGLAWKLPPTSSATATVLLLSPRAGGAYQPPPSASALTGVPAKVYNPYLSFDSSLYVLASIVAADLNSEDLKQQLRAKGATATYDVTTNGNQPSLTIVATDHDPRKALETANAVVNGLQSDLVERQGPIGIPQENWVAASPLVLPSHAVLTTSKLKVLGVVAGIGLLAAVSMTFVAESLGVGRRASGRTPAPNGAAVEPAQDVAFFDPSKTRGRERTPRVTWVLSGDQPAPKVEEAPREASGQG